MNELVNEYLGSIEDWILKTIKQAKEAWSKRLQVSITKVFYNISISNKILKS